MSLISSFAVGVSLLFLCISVVEVILDRIGVETGRWLSDKPPALGEGEAVDSEG